MNEPEKCKVQFLAIDLSEGRKVCVGYNAEDAADQSIFLRFTASDGAVTKTRLSAEAFSAMVRLKEELSIYRDGQQVFRYVVHVDAEKNMRVEFLDGPHTATPTAPAGEARE